MRLSEKEFKAMNNPLRQFFQQQVEFRIFKLMGLEDQPGDILEIGCGSGYGAQLLDELQPSSYTGVDVMPEQIELARKRQVRGAKFLLQDASDLPDFDNGSFNAVVVFGVLHHIPQWKSVLQECYRVLKPGGQVFIEEPDGGLLELWERFFNWGHPEAAAFRLKDFESNIRDLGFQITKCIRGLGFGIYALTK